MENTGNVLDPENGVGGSEEPNGSSPATEDPDRLLTDKGISTEENERSHVGDESAPEKWKDPLTICTLFLALVTLWLVILTHRDAREAVAAAERANERLVEVQKGISEDSIKAQKLINEAIIRNQKEMTTKAIGVSADQSSKTLQMTATLAMLDQRPWLSVRRFEFPEAEDGKEFRVRLSIQNTGKTAALNFVEKQMVFFEDGEPAPTSYSEIKAFVGPSNVPASTDNNWIVTGSWTPGVTYLQEYREHKRNVYLHAHLEYSDLFGSSHITEVCAYHIYDRPADEVVWCAGNMMK